MTKAIIPTASNLQELNNGEPENGVKWDTLSDKEKLVLMAMLVGKTDAEALRLSPVKRTQFYQYKERLQPLKEQFISQLLSKAAEILQGNVLKASETLTGLLDDENPKTRQLAAESILDRTIGRPNMVQPQQTNNQIMNFTLIGVEQSKIDALFRPKQSKEPVVDTLPQELPPSDQVESEIPFERQNLL